MLANSVDPDQMPKYAAYSVACVQALHSLLTGIDSIENITPKNENKYTRRSLNEKWPDAICKDRRAK